MSNDRDPSLVRLDPEKGLWERFFTVAPLVLVGTVGPNGEPDLAPKHMAFPLGWSNYFGFVCTPSHSTYQNVERTGSFAVSYPRPGAIVETSLTASPRIEEEKPIVGMLETFEPDEVQGVFVKSGYLFLECELVKIVDGFGRNALIAGRVVAAHAHADAVRQDDRDDAQLLLDSPQLAYLYPGRFAVIDSTQAFPFPAGMRR